MPDSAVCIDFREQRSELALPELVREQVSIQFALVDGWHTFDQVMVEFYFLNRMLDVGGVILFDDADRRSVNRAIRHALTYPAYRVYAAEEPAAAPRALDAGTAAAGDGIDARRRHHRPAGRAESRLGPWHSRIVHRDSEDRAKTERSSGWDRAF